MKRPAKLLFAACLATIVAVAAPNITTAAESDAPTQVLVQVDIPDQPQPAPLTSGEVQRPSDVKVDEALTRSDRSSLFIVWLLKADGTQVLPANYRCEYARVDPAKPRRHLEVAYEFPLP